MRSTRISELFGASLVALILIYGTTTTSVQAQVTGGTISGTVLDSSDKTIPNATISITNSATGINRTVTTNTDGFYTAPNLQAGTYDVTFTAPGFKTEVKKGVDLAVGAASVLDLTMKIGTTIETVQVQTDVPDVQLTTSDIGAVVNATTVRELPLNGRSWTDLATLQPGVNRIQTQPDFSQGTDRGNRGFGQQLTISGARPQQNNYRLDGVSLNDYANGAPGSVLGGSLGVDAIQEFSVLTSNYSADYGKTSGGVVNAITRSGTNQIHGSAYEFLRNNHLDARNFFDDPGQPTPAFKRNQFGGAIGGPIIKNRTFFFADYEGTRQSKGITTVATVPSVDARNGILHDGGPNVPVDPSAAAYLTFFPIPQTTEANSDIGTFTFAGQQIVNENFLTARIDHRFSERDSLFGSYMFDKTPYSAPDGLNNVEFTSRTSRQFVSIEETHVFTPAFANSFRIGGNHEAVSNNESLKAINPDAARADLGVGGTAFAGRDAAQVLIGNVSDFTGGIGGSPTYFYHWNSAQVYDDAFYTKGKHAIKFGGVVERMLLNVLADTDPNGIFNFENIRGFLTNQPTRFQGGIASTLSPRNLRQTLFGAYLQDDWRILPNLTFNLGLRYEMTTTISETSGKLANLRNISDELAVCGRMATGCSGTGPFFGNPTLRDFEPRFGFAWDPLKNGRTALRGGIGMFDVQPLPYQYILLATQASPFFSYTVNRDVQGVCNPKCDTPFFNFQGQDITFPANRLRTTYTDPNPKRTYVMQWNVNLQQQLTPSLSVMAAYVGSRGVHQPFRVDDANLAIPTKTAAGYVWGFNPDSESENFGQPLDPINTHFGSIRGMFYKGGSSYHALETQVAKRMSHGFQVQGTFTWSKSIDTSSASVAGDTFGNSISSLNWFDLSLGRGVSDFNVGRTLVLNGTWELPSPKAWSGTRKWAAEGWQLGLIFTASDGVPFTPTWGTGSDPANTASGDDWAYVNRLGGPGCKTLTRPGNVNGYIKTECFQVPTAPDLAFWNANCNPLPPSLGVQINNPQDPAADGLGYLPALPCFNLRGNAGRNILTGPGLTSLDFSIFKNNYVKRISERFNVQFRAEIFNILNHANFAPPTTPTHTDIFDGTGNLSDGVGRLTSTTTTAREIQFAIKVIF